VDEVVDAQAERWEVLLSQQAFGEPQAQGSAGGVIAVTGGS